MTAPSQKSDPPIDLSGRTLGDFHILRKIGQGGMGQVYLARQQSLKREVALKILRRELAENATALQRFQAEAEAVARISHPNIVQVYAVGEQDGLRYMALEYVDGRNLRDYLDRKGPPDLPVALAIMKQVAAALQRASELGIVHRDVKPENILLTRKVQVKVTDFGLSRYFAADSQPLSLTQSGMTLGTPLYMSPEQVQGKTVDHRSDLYSFGVTCYHMFAGEPPFRAANAFDVAVQHVHGQPEPLTELRPDLSPDLCALVARLMAKLPGDRYQSAKDFLRDLARLQKGLPLSQSGQVEAVPGTSTTGVGESALHASGNPAGLQRPHGSSSIQPIASASSPVFSMSGVQNSASVIPASSGIWSRRRRLLALTGLTMVILGGVASGWFLYLFAHPAKEQNAGQGTGALPEIRQLTLVSTQEKQLKGQFKVRPPVEGTARAGMELGILYVRDRRWDDALETFRVLESFRAVRNEHVLPAHVVGKLGQAVALAQQDRAKESIEVFVAAENQLRQVRPVVARTEIDRFFFGNPEFGIAIAEALARNAEVQKLPSQIDWLRSPSGILRGPK